MPNETMLDKVATDLALWIDEYSTKIALAMAPQGTAPFAAPGLSETDKLEYYRAQLFNPDGTPNVQGRAQEMQRLGPQGFTQVYKAVLKAYPDLKLPTPPGVTQPGGAATQAAPALAPSPVPAPYLPRGAQTANAPTITPIPMASGGVVTEPTVALIGEQGPEAVVPLTDAGQLSSPDTRAQVLRNYGWTEDAIQKALSVPTYVPNTPSPVPNTFGGYTEASEGYPQGQINLYQPDINKATAEQQGLTPGGLATASPEAIYAHEAQHALYALDPVVSSGQYHHGQDAATVVNDLNMLRSYAATQGNRKLYDAANAAMDATSTDPAHVNHYLIYTGTIEGAPDWYLAKYYPFMQEAPSWSGTPAQSAPLTVDSSRLQGQAPPPPRRTA